MISDKTHRDRRFIGDLFSFGVLHVHHAAAAAGPHLAIAARRQQVGAHIHNLILLLASDYSTLDTRHARRTVRTQRIRKLSLLGRSFSDRAQQFFELTAAPGVIDIITTLDAPSARGPQT